MQRWTKEPVKEILDQIDKDDHEERILYLEEQATVLASLDDHDRFYCTYHYVHSLHALERYDDLLNSIDQVIEYVFIHDVEYIPSRTYEHLLFIETEALYESLQYESALDIGKQLLGMHPSDQRYRKMVEKTFRSFYNFKSATTKLAALILIFSSSIISAIFWYMTRQGDEQSMTFAFSIIVAPSLLAVLILGGAQMYHYFKSIKQTEALVELKMKQRRAAKV